MVRMVYRVPLKYLWYYENRYHIGITIKEKAS